MADHLKKNLAVLLLLLFQPICAQVRAPHKESRAATPASDSSNAAGRSIKGRVVEGGRPVADAAIVCVPATWSSDITTTMATMLNQISSDTEGRFEISNLTPGAYSIAASSPGLVPADTGRIYRPGDAVTISLVKGGVITGAVTNQFGDPIVDLPVRAIFVRDFENRPATPEREPNYIQAMMLAVTGGWRTDDRGIYRIYGLAPGIYQVAAGGSGSIANVGVRGLHSNDAATYYPSSTPDTAQDVTVRSGDEINGVDIRYRDFSGHTISGVVKSPTRAGRGIASILLGRAAGGIEATTYAMPRDNEAVFAIEGVSDGDYFLSGTNTSLPGISEVQASEPLRVSVRGADVTGIELKLEPVTSLMGRVALEPLDPAQKNACKDLIPSSVREVVLSAIAMNESTDSKANNVNVNLAALNIAAPDEKGEFVLRGLSPGLNRIRFDLPGESLYIKAITMPSAAPNGAAVDVAKSGVAIKRATTTKGLVVTMSEGAAGMRGRVVVGDDQKPPKSRMSVYLVPSERDALNAVLRYSETNVAADGVFSFTHLAPGKYWLVARETDEKDAGKQESLPLAFDAGGRRGLRFEGEALKKTVELSPCQRIAEYVLRYEPLVVPAKSNKKPAP